jgi:ribonuclease Z
MQRVFHGLVNGSFGDPALHLEAGGYGTLFDCGDLVRLSAPRIHRVRDLFVTHAHIDHFFGFDWLLRIFLGADRKIRVFGPEGIAARVGAKLDGYTWNIEMDFCFEAEVYEVAKDLSHATVSTFRCRHGLERRIAHEERPLAGGVLVETPRHRVLAAEVDHGTPALAFRYEQRRGIRIREDRLLALGLARGPWLQRLKAALLGPPRPPDEVFEADTKSFPLGEIAALLTEEVRGTTIAYVTDTRLRPEVAARLARLVEGADCFYCEAKYLEKDREKAEAARHLTAREAGELARATGARELVLFHPSPKYQDDYGRVLDEARRAFPSARFQEKPGFAGAGA